jgi:nucleoside-diphosphate-sugar epimerase
MQLISRRIKMTGEILVLGYGAVGKATVARLLAEGREVTVAQRNRPKDLPQEAQFITCDVLDLASLKGAAKNASQIVVALGFKYDGKVWRNAWPRAMANIIEVCAKGGQRIVFVDNLYMYGPQTAPLREDMPLSNYGAKPAIRAEVTRLWMDAAAAGHIKIAALRAPDFYGPHVELSLWGPESLGAIAKGKAGRIPMPLDVPHDFAYVPDFARAVVTLLDAADDAYGQAWHVPVAPTRTAQEIIDIAERHLGHNVKVSTVSPLMLKLLGLFIPFIREFNEMSFNFDKPYHVDASKFSKRFWSDATPFEVGVGATVDSFKV